MESVGKPSTTVAPATPAAGPRVRVRTLLAVACRVPRPSARGRGLTCRRRAASFAAWP
jgi:hypothetical protein